MIDARIRVIVYFPFVRCSSHSATIDARFRLATSNSGRRYDRANDGNDGRAAKKVHPPAATSGPATAVPTAPAT